MKIPAVTINGLFLGKGERKGIERSFGLSIHQLKIPQGERVLIIGPRKAGKTLLIESIDSGVDGVEISPEVQKLRVNSCSDVTEYRGAKPLLILSEGHKMALQYEILKECPPGATVLASVDRDQLVGATVFEPFSRVLLLVEGEVAQWSTSPDFLNGLPNLLSERPCLISSFSELTTLFNASPGLDET